LGFLYWFSVNVPFRGEIQATFPRVPLWFVFVDVVANEVWFMVQGPGNRKVVSCEEERRIDRADSIRDLPTIA